MRNAAQPSSSRDYIPDAPCCLQDLVGTSDFSPLGVVELLFEMIRFDHRLGSEVQLGWLSAHCILSWCRQGLLRDPGSNRDPLTGTAAKLWTSGVAAEALDDSSF